MNNTTILEQPTTERPILTVEQFRLKAKRLAAALKAEEKRGLAETGIVHMVVRATTAGYDRKAEAGQAYLNAIKHRSSQ